MQEYNMSMRKFLKQVGVTSQQAIEEAIRRSGRTEQDFTVRAVITIDELDLRHEVEGKIGGRS